MFPFYTREVFPSNSIEEGKIEFEFESDIIFLEMRDTHLRLKLQFFKGGLLDAVKKRKPEHKVKSEDYSDEKPQTYLIYVSNLLRSLITNCEVYFNTTMAHNVNGLDSHKAQTSNEFNLSAVSNKGNFACQ